MAEAASAYRNASRPALGQLAFDEPENAAALGLYMERADSEEEMSFHHLWEDGGPSFELLVSKLAPSVHAASNPFADWYFGDRDVAAELIEEWMVRPSSEVYLGRGIVMMAEQEPVGVLIGMSGAQLSACRNADFGAFCEEIGSGEEVDEIVEQVVTVSRELFPPVEPDTFYISRVAVVSQHRGRGFGRRLVEHTMEAKRRDGFDKFRLDVSAENAGAIHVYESLGLKRASRSQSTIAPLEYFGMCT